MGLFDKLLKKKEEIIVAPASGKMIPASEINDPVFGEEMIGQTIGIIPSSGDIVCPVDGEVEVAFPTGHAFGIKGNDGNSYLVHIGIDTVSLAGKGFDAKLRQGQKVKAGELAVVMDIDHVKNAGLDPAVMLIVSEKKKDDFKVDYIDYKDVEKGEKINK